jgi:hypothetical protein
VEAREDALFSHDIDIKEFCSYISGKVAVFKTEKAREGVILIRIGTYHVVSNLYGQMICTDVKIRLNSQLQRVAWCGAYTCCHCALKGACELEVLVRWWLNWDTCSNVQFCITS